MQSCYGKTTYKQGILGKFCHLKIPFAKLRLNLFFSRILIDSSDKTHRAPRCFPIHKSQFRRSSSNCPRAAALPLCHHRHKCLCIKIPALFPLPRDDDNNCLCDGMTANCTRNAFHLGTLHHMISLCSDVVDQPQLPTTHHPPPRTSSEGGWKRLSCCPCLPALPNAGQGDHFFCLFSIFCFLYISKFLLSYLHRVF